MDHPTRIAGVAIPLLALLLGTTPVALGSGSAIQEVQVQFPKGKTGTTMKGKLKGDQTVDYKLRAAAGQSMVVVFQSSNPSAYFNVLPPVSDMALFVGSTSGNRYEGTLPADGTYTIRLYLMRSAARRNESTTYTLDVSVPGSAKTPD
jgi:hypothetical protein